MWAFRAFVLISAPTVDLIVQKQKSVKSSAATLTPCRWSSHHLPFTHASTSQIISKLPLFAGMPGYQELWARYRFEITQSSLSSLFLSPPPLPPTRKASAHDENKAWTEVFPPPPTLTQSSRFSPPCTSPRFRRKNSPSLLFRQFHTRNDSEASRKRKSKQRTITKCCRVAGKWRWRQQSARKWEWDELSTIRARLAMCFSGDEITPEIIFFSLHPRKKQQRWKIILWCNEI